MSDVSKRARESNRPARRDPRVEPQTVPPPIHADVAPVGRARVTSAVKDAGLNGNASSAPKAADDASDLPQAAERRDSSRQQIARVHDSSSPPDAAKARREMVTPREAPLLDPAQLPTEAGGVGQLRRKIAALQNQLADVQRQLGEQQEERAEDADKMAHMADQSAAADARVLAASKRAEDAERLLEETQAALHVEKDKIVGMTADLTHEREFVQQLRVSVQQKYEDCEALRARVHEQDAQTAKQHAEADAQVREVSARLALATGELAPVKAALAEAKKEAEASKKDADAFKREAEAAKKDTETKDKELTRVNAGLKQANTTAFAASKAKDVLTAQVEELRGALKSTQARAEQMKKHIEASTEMLTLAGESLKATEQTEAEITRIRESASAARRRLLDQAMTVRNTLKQAAEAPETMQDRNNVTVEMREVELRPEDFFDEAELAKG